MENGHTELLGKWIKHGSEQSRELHLLRGRVLQMEQQIEVLKEDAERYRYLRDQHSCAWEEELDEEILSSKG